jgi:NADPH:quinone reductase-like Zn-dependent oxidoreductase
VRAIAYDQYGTPANLHPTDVPIPTPTDDEVLIKVHAVSLNAGDVYRLSGTPLMMRPMFGLRKPSINILGMDIAGVVEKVGRNIIHFKPGDEVFVDTSECGSGGFAEYVCACTTAIAHKPADLSFEQASTLPTAGVTALQGLRDGGNLQAGEQVLIHGASGGVGTFAVQIAKAMGAEVTALCSTRHVDIVRSLGADHIIDYTQEDFATSGKKYDLIFAVNGDRSLADYRKALKPDGRYTVSGGSLRQIFAGMLLGPLMALGSQQSMGTLGSIKLNSKDLNTLAQMVTSGAITPVIDRCFPLEDTSEAMQYYVDGKAHGKVVVKVI